MPIENFPQQNIRELLSYLPQLRTMNLSAGMIPPTRQAADLLHAFDRLSFTKTGFDYNTWLAVRPEGFAEDITALETADFETLRNLVTANLRIERFVGGYLDNLLQNGYFHKVLERVEELNNA